MANGPFILLLHCIAVNLLQCDATSAAMLIDILQVKPGHCRSQLAVGCSKNIVKSPHCSSLHLAATQVKFILTLLQYCNAE